MPAAADPRYPTDGKGDRLPETRPPILRLRAWTIWQVSLKKVALNELKKEDLC
jgi:hypothetical protein